MLDKPRILSLFPTRLMNPIKHEHSSKILNVIALYPFQSAEVKSSMSTRKTPECIQTHIIERCLLSPKQRTSAFVQMLSVYEV